MGKGVAIGVVGMDKIQNRFGKIPDHVAAEVDAELNSLAREYENKAIDSAPHDNGILKGGINYERLALMDYQVVSSASYSAFIEFGTRSKVQVPAGLEAYASQFKGASAKGDAKKAIFEWCRRKGIEEKFWWPIFIKIMTVGSEPHPFFFKHLPWAQSQVNKNLGEVVKRALSK